MPVKVLLKLNDDGSPIVRKAMGNARGVIVLPPTDESGASEDPGCEYELNLFIQAGSSLTNNGTLVLNTTFAGKIGQYDISNDFETTKSIDYQKNKNIESIESIKSKQKAHTDKNVKICLNKPGPYYYYITYTPLEPTEKEDTKKSTEKCKTHDFYFIVPPKLPFGIKLDSVSLQTLVSKWIPICGKNENEKSNIETHWDPILNKIASKGYNMIHFTPLQERGSSNSPYSIYDQLNYDPQHFPHGLKDVKLLMNHIHKTHNLLSLTDIVLNHTANNSYWLKDHPDAGYNQCTAPHLKPAIELEQELTKFSDLISGNQLENISPNIETENDLINIMSSMESIVFQKNLKLWEYYIIDINKLTTKIKCLLNNSTDSEDGDGNNTGDIEEKKFISENYVSTLVEKCCLECQIDNDDQSNENDNKIIDIAIERFGHQLDPLKFIDFLKTHFANNIGNANDSSINILQFATKILEQINSKQYMFYDNDIKTIKDQLYNRIKYLRLDSHGPKLGKITKSNPLIEKYFTVIEHTDGLQGKFYLANNGWIWNGNPLLDFASNKSKAYLRREVIVWEDCVKLRYGDSPKDSPYLWERMSQYIVENASIFNGFRIDNCHSTPLHIGTYFLALARSVNPNLYVLAELFSGDEQLDCVFVEKLGINSLLRESMQANSVQELSTLIHRYAGNPIGTFKNLNFDDYSLKHYDHQMLRSTQPPVLIMDCTHDNQTPYQKRTVEDTIANAALVSFSCSAIGSVYGFDEIFPYLLDVVNEKRNYSVVNNDGISQVKKKLYSIRASIAKDINDYEMFIHQDGDFVTFHRVNIKTGKGWYLIAKTKFTNSDDGNTEEKVSFNLASTFDCSLKFAYSLIRTGDPIDDPETIKGIPTKILEHDINDFKISISDDNNCDIAVPNSTFPKGSIAVFETEQHPAGWFLNKEVVEECVKASESLTLDALNVLLYRCEPEERDFSAGAQGTYDIPNHGKLSYAGLQGWVSILKNITFNNEVDHPYCDNLRTGTWALDYMESRLDPYCEKFPEIVAFQKWLKEILAKVSLLPAGLRPAYFAVIVSLAYKCCVKKALQLMDLDDNGKEDDSTQVTLFQKQLGLVSVQMCSLNYSASLVPNTPVSSMAAGLPHFSSEWARCWGRDVFISLRGLLLSTKRFEEAKLHILGFAKTLKHGLIPNLLDSGNNPRYNSRDSVWFFVQAIKDYVTVVPGGEAILKERVKRRFPLNDEYLPLNDPKVYSYETSIGDIIFEIFQRHAKGIHFREANAGPQLDRVIKSEGFNIDIKVDWNTGLIFGGSQDNCGTWMDKMGESEKAHSVGVPGTPRDGASVEIIGLLKSSLNFVNSLHSKKLFEYDSVSREDGTSVTFKEWETLILNSFEHAFYVPLDPNDDFKYDIDSNIVNRRGIYKDLYKSGKPYEDYQLRPNVMVAMCVAPGLFQFDHALNCIDKVDKYLKGPLGMRTLDPSDYNYRPYYINSEDSDDFATSKGRNYHQGPEWVWCFGYFIRAYYYFNKKRNQQNKDRKQDLELDVLNKLLPHKKWISESVWAGLTELTNKDGSLCNDSSPTQAWSAACLLDFYLDLKRE